MFPLVCLIVIAFPTPPKLDVKIGNDFFEDVSFDDDLTDSSLGKGKFCHREDSCLHVV
jgi:hypothetical protein